jgi:hypothetical protein
MQREFFLTYNRERPINEDSVLGGEGRTGCLDCPQLRVLPSYAKLVLKTCRCDARDLVNASPSTSGSLRSMGLREIQIGVTEGIMQSGGRGASNPVVVER